jgi:predicted PurR-regulated permease PerM
MLQKFFGVASIAVEVAGAIAVMLFLGLYFAADANLYMSGLLRLVPPAHRARGAEILHETASAIWYWMLGRLVSMAVRSKTRPLTAIRNTACQVRQSRKLF